MHIDMPVALFKAGVSKGNIFMLLEVSFISCFLFNILFLYEFSRNIQGGFKCVGNGC